MKAKLIKKTFSGDECQYTLYLDGEVGIYAKSGAGHGWFKLSKQNCDEIFGVTDVEKLAQDYAKSQCEDLHDELGKTGAEWGWETALDFKNGFNKAMELNGDKQFTLEDMKKAISFGQGMDLWKEEEQIDKFIQSRQQPTEIEVEIEMEVVPDFYPRPDEDGSLFTSNKKEQPKLDGDGCLMLKKIEQ